MYPQQWSSASPEWPQNLYSTALKTVENGKSFLHFHELIFSHKFYSTDASAAVQILGKTQATSDEDENPKLRDVNNEEEEDTLPELTKTVETPKKEKRKLRDAIREIRQVLEKGDKDMEETLTQLGLQLTPRLVKTVLDTTSSPNSALRFFQWANAQPGFEPNIATYDKLVDILGRSKDFETLLRVSPERSGSHSNNFAKTFSFYAMWHDDSDTLNEVMEMFDKLELSIRREAYERLIVTLCEKNHVNAALKVLEKMASVDCAPRMSTYRPLIQVYCQNNQMDKVQGVFEMMKDYPQDSFCYNTVLKELCNRKQFAEATEWLQSMVNMGCKLDAFTYDIMIRAACKTGGIQGALQLFDRLKKEGINPLYATYSNLLNRLLIKGFEEAHSFLTQQCGKDPKLDLFIYSHLIKVCSKSGRHQEASNLLKEKKAKGIGASV
jgi:pentatricopeptide repeat protein